MGVRAPSSRSWCSFTLSITMAISADKQPEKLLKAPKALKDKFNANADLFKINRVYAGTGLVVNETPNGKIISLDPSIFQVIQNLIQQQGGTGTGPTNNPSTTVPGVNTDPIQGSDGKLYKNGQPLNGDYNGTNYTDGTPTNGWGTDANGNAVYYTDGLPASDVIDGVLYYNGQPFTGVDGSGIYYANGVPAAGTFNGITYGADGHPVSGTSNGVLYSNGLPVTGISGSGIYTNGILDLALQTDNSGNFYITSTKGNHVVVSPPTGAAPWFVATAYIGNSNSVQTFFKIGQSNGQWQSYSDYGLGAATIFGTGSFSSALQAGLSAGNA
jgi:hypothetical protein